MKTTWIINKTFPKYHSNGIEDFVVKQGHNLVLYDKTLQDITLDSRDSYVQEINGPVVIYGQHQFVRALRASNGNKLQPGELGVNNRTKVSSYLGNLPNEYFLNNNGIFVTWAMFKHNFKTIYQNYFDENSLFIRPNSGFKTFAGQVIAHEDIEFEINSMEQLTSVMDDTLIFVSPPKELIGEFRFVIADKEVIDGSEYRWDNILDVRHDWTQECWELADKIAKHEWQVDIAYVCDVAMTNNGPKIVELNGFSCAGLYSCDLDIVVDKISKAAIKEYKMSQ